MESATTLEVPVAVVASPLDERMPGKALLLPMVKMLSKMTGHTPTAREEAAEYGRPDSFMDFEQEQEQEKTLTPIG